MSEIRYVPPAAPSGPTGSGAAGQVTFWSAATVLTGSNNLFWDNTNARLGIGTGTPGVKLDVHGTGIIQQLNGTTTNNSYLDFQNAGSTKFRIGNTYNAGQNRLSIFNAAGSTEIITAFQTGNVGIATTTDAGFKLDVNGTARISAKFSVLNSSTQGIVLDNSYGPQPQLLWYEGTLRSTIVREPNNGLSFGFGPTQVFGAHIINTGTIIGNGNNGVSRSNLFSCAQLQVDSTVSGFMPPRMTNAQRIAIGSPQQGLIVYCTDAVEGLYIYKSTGWTFII